MKYLIVLFSLISFSLFGQSGIEPTSFQGTPYKGGIMVGITPIIDEFTGDTIYLYQHSDTSFVKIDSLVFTDSLRLYTSQGVFTTYISSGGGSGDITDVTVSAPITGGGTSGSVNIAINTANGSTTGAITDTDWTTFNNKVGGSGTANQFAYFSGANTLTSSSVFSFNTHGVTLQKGTWNAFINGGNNTLSGTSNVGIGSNQTLSSLTSGTNNVGLGNAAGFGNTSGSNNFYLGYLAGYTNATSSDNVFIGGTSGYTVTGANNCYIGAGSGYNAGASSSTTAIGSLAGYSGGSSNVDIGFYAGFGGTGSFNTRLGRQAGQSSGASNGNIYIGYAAGQNNTGSNNTIVGYQAGATGDGSTNIFLGHNAGFNETGSNTLYLTNSAGTSSGIYGDFANSRFGVNQAPSAMTNTFDINGTLRVRTTTGTATNVMGRDANGVMTTLGLTNLSISGGNLVGPTIPETWANISNHIVSWGSTGTFGSGYPVAVGVTSATQDVDINGHIRLRGAIYDAATNSSGTSGQVLTSQGAGSPWIWTTPTIGGSFSFGTGASTGTVLTDGSGAAYVNGGTNIETTRSGTTVTVRQKSPYTMMTIDIYNQALTTTNTKMALTGSSVINGDGTDVNFDNTNDEIDILTTGTYKISYKCNCKSNTAAVTVQFNLIENVSSATLGAVSTHYFNNTSEFCHNNMEYIYPFTAGDRFSLYAKTISGTTTIQDCNIRMFAERVK